MRYQITTEGNLLITSRNARDDNKKHRVAGHMNHDHGYFILNEGDGFTLLGPSDRETPKEMAADYLEAKRKENQGVKL